ncbi:MAG TPA: phosphotransferase, partial [Nocardioidaceae bacterium]|nr:phosphotransferase [Nocardioidaceae bacterium]
ALEQELVPPVLAVEPHRGWWLSRDAGPVLRSVAPPDQLWHAWEAILLRYAEAQLRLAGKVDALLSTGVAEVSPATLPELAGTLLKRLGEMSPEKGGLTAAEQEALAGRLSEYAAWCAELEASGIPSSIQHDDLHSSNICSGGSADTARIIDWGDASVGFPLATMLCTMNSLAWHARVELDDPRVVRVRDAYLEPFTRFADRESLVRYVGLARRTGCVARALSYEAALREEPLATHVEQDFPVRGWLLEMLAD